MTPVYYFILFVFLFTSKFEVAEHQDPSSFSILIAGDVMGHGSQVKAAQWTNDTSSFDYMPVFKHVRPYFESVDYCIANLEVNLADTPYLGYPKFSSPDELAVALKNSGVDCVTFANNHTDDNDRSGIMRTLAKLDSIKLHHIGVFRDRKDRKKRNVFVVKKNGIRVGILNYTYGVNQSPVAPPSLINTINKHVIEQDLARLKQKNPDYIVVITHWGLEYKQHPYMKQREIAQFCFEHGADAVVGGHPHVLQPMHYYPETDRLLVYSLGNFVSGQIKKGRDGGAMFRLKLEKKNGKISLVEKSYILTWVYRPYEHGRRRYYVLPVKDFETNSAFFQSPNYFNKMLVFATDSRSFFNKNNTLVTEYE